ncbi:MAG: DUF4139 domain-containing protein [Nitrospinae bacterium]|nr:DUF4139 domain-containing protein [Nitrospinota bacterium]MBF0634913.1 DUF4139 domain-containing protein [Nitrospinota bacterium]
MLTARVALISTVACLTVFSASNIAIAVEFADTGKIESAVVFKDRALVKRSVKLEFEQGSNTLLISGIPASADERTARISGSATSPMTIVGVRFAPVELSKPADPKEAVVTEKIEKLQRDIKKLDYKINARKEQLGFIERLTGGEKKSGSQIPLHRPGMQDMEKLMDFIYTRGTEAGAAIFDAQMEQEKAKKEIERLQRELSHMRSRQSKGYKNIIVEFRADAKGKGTFTAEMIIPDAGWEPFYTAKADAAKNEIRVSFSALVRQRTGEDWDGVKLTLSTASPGMWMSAPEIQPWIIFPLQPVTPRSRQLSAPAPAFAPQAIQDQASVKSKAEGVMEQEAPATVEYAASTRDVTATSFEAPGRAAVKSGGEKTRVSVAEIPFKAEWSYYAVPKLYPRVYLRGKFVNTTETALPAGEVQALAGDSFAGMGWMKPVAPGQETTMDFGVDEGFKLERKLVKKETGREGMMSKRNSVRYIYETTIENHKQVPITVELADQLPLPSDEAIKLEDSVLKPKPDKRDERNILTWNVALAPNEKKMVRMEFTVEYPREMNIAGLFE